MFWLEGLQDEISSRAVKMRRVPAMVRFSFLGLCAVVTMATWAHAHIPHDVVSHIAVTPAHAQEEAVFIVVRNNLLKSTDGGLIWERVVRGLDNRYRISGLQLSASDPNVLFASTLGDGVYRSHDRGESWSRANEGLPDLVISQVFLSPASSELVFAAGADSGLFRSLDGGVSWHQVLANTRITALAFLPQEGGRLIIGDSGGSLRQSADDGSTWSVLKTIPAAGEVTTVAAPTTNTANTSFFVGTTNRGVFRAERDGAEIALVHASEGISDPHITALAISPNYENDRTLWASSWHEAVFLSEDGGDTWDHVSDSVTKSQQADRHNVRHFSALAPSGSFRDDSTVFLGGFDGLFRSTDGGSTWAELPTFRPELIIAAAFSPNYDHDGAIIVTTYNAGTFISRNRGESWTQSYTSSRTLARRGVGVAFSPSYAIDDTIFLSSWNIFRRSEDAGVTWTKTDKAFLPKRDPTALKNTQSYAIAISPAFPLDGTIFLGSNDGRIFKSTDRGATFTVLADLGEDGSVDPGGSAAIPAHTALPLGLLSLAILGWRRRMCAALATTLAGLVLVAGCMATPIPGISEPIGNAGLISFAISPDFSFDQTLFASSNKGLFRTVDGGLTWSRVAVFSDSDTALPSEPILSISPNYRLDRMVLAGSNHGLFETTDGGDTWHAVEALPPADRVIIKGIAFSTNFQNDQTVVVTVKGLGMFRSVDGGKSYQRIGNDVLLSGMDNVKERETFTRRLRLPSPPIEFSPAYADDRTLLGYTGTRLLLSEDGGETWDLIFDLPTGAGSTLAM